jgi:hypothetical protein
MKLEFDAPSKCFYLVCKFELLNLNASMSFFVCFFPSFLAMEPHFPLVFLVSAN